MKRKKAESKAKKAKVKIRLTVKERKKEDKKCSWHKLTFMGRNAVKHLSIDIECIAIATVKINLHNM